MAVNTKPPRILLITAGFGEGHNAAARNLKAALEVESPQARVLLQDTYLEAYGGLNRMAHRAYALVIDRLPLLWQAFFQMIDRKPFIEENVGLLGKAVKHMRRTLEEFRPHVVVSTYPGYGALLDYLFAGRPRPFRFVTVVTDSITINAVWLRSRTDFFLVPNEMTRVRLLAWGIPEKKILVTGFPVPLVFSEFPAGMRSNPGPGCLPRVLYIVNSHPHEAFEVVSEVLKSEVCLTVAHGNRRIPREKLMKLAAEQGRKLEIMGWVSDMPRQMALHHLVVSKAGGATVQECLAAGTPVIASHVVPGQEEGNARLLVEGECGGIADSPREVGKFVRECFAGDAALWRKWAVNAGRMGIPDASVRAARFLLEQCRQVMLAREN